MKILFQGDSITDGNRYKSKASAWDKNHQNKKRGFPQKMWKTSFFFIKMSKKKMTPEGVIFLLIFND